ncbi:MAG: ribosomal L7Ae/L30e/S12e/Gadd45 family protein [Oscillospiraceae bacterium]|nr:ribosomal L7Ae/L30e/S12e/Gadd45 family protein [Oscillospiraceae bacterium]
MDKALSVLSIARKAGKLQPGEEAATSAARDKKARLILLASDTAENTASKMTFIAERFNCPIFTVAVTKEELGAAVGISRCAVLAVTDMGLAALTAERLAAKDSKLGPAAQEMRAKADKMDRRKKQTAKSKKKRG